MGKRRNTAKTGDKKIYRQSVKEQQGDDDADHDRSDDDDPMYDRVDRFHNAKDQQDFLKLDTGDDDGGGSSSSDNDEREEAVMDLGLGGGDDDDDESSSSSDDDDKESKHEDDSEPENHVDDLSSSGDETTTTTRMWKKTCETGVGESLRTIWDTADLEIGQDEEDAVLEEQAAKEVQAARYDEMSEDDFVLSDTEEHASQDDGEGDLDVSAARNVSKLSLKDKQKLLDRQHPELLPLLLHFSTIAEDLRRNTSVAAKALFEGEEGTAEVSKLACRKRVWFGPNAPMIGYSRDRLLGP